MRGERVGQALVEHLTELAFAAGFSAVYLNATPANATYNQRFGWSILEQDVEGMTVMIRSQPLVTV
jgi:N-acetylglutamate synthase-like GNAT family acetyltransferase